MAVRQYTQCVDVENFDPGNPLTGALLLGLYMTLPPGAFAALLAIAGVGSPWCLLFLAEVYASATVVGYCYWFLYRRLICIPAPPEHPADSAGHHLVIGTLINILTPDPVGDNDYSIGILPSCIPLGAQGPFKEPFTAANPAPPGPFGYLITEQPVTKNYPLLYTGHPDYDTDADTCPVDRKQSEVLHCEFEGSGMYYWFLAAQVALLVGFAAVFACLFHAPWWVTLILALLAGLLLGGGLALGLATGGDPHDVNPNIGELHTNQCNHTGADTLVVKGRWVYDSGHRFPLVNYVPFLGHQRPGAWNELHPITFCCRTCPVSASECVNGTVILLRKRWENAIGDATSTATLESQKQPQNQWQVHPIIDGCQPSGIIV
jgi:hypothetical protein